MRKSVGVVRSLRIAKRSLDECFSATKLDQPGTEGWPSPYVPRTESRMISPEMKKDPKVKESYDSLLQAHIEHLYYRSYRTCMYASVSR